MLLTRRVFLGGVGLVLASRPLAALERAQIPSWPTRPAARPLHAPTPSDVAFSPRFAGSRPYPRENDPLAAAAAFGATRIDWCYNTDPAVWRSFRERGVRSLGAALTPSMRDAPGVRTTDVGRIMDKTGARLTSPWLRPNGPAFGCANSPAFREIYIAYARAQLAAGVDHFQVDDPASNLTMVSYGGCWCESCRQAASAQGYDLAVDMRRFQKASVERFIKFVRASLDEIAKRPVTVSCNNGSREGWPETMFDFEIGEVDFKKVSPETLAAWFVQAEMEGRPLIVTLRSADRRQNEIVASWAYANGGLMLCPWDIWMPGSRQRFYADPADYVSVYGFCRESAGLLDKTGPVPGWSDRSGSWSADRATVRASLRVDAARKTAALHMVDWSPGELQPFQFTIDPQGLLPAGAPVAAARLLGPNGKAEALETVDGKLVGRAGATPWSIVELQVGS